MKQERMAVAQPLRRARGVPDAHHKAMHAGQDHTHWRELRAERGGRRGPAHVQRRRRSRAFPPRGPRARGPGHGLWRVRAGRTRPGGRRAWACLTDRSRTRTRRPTGRARLQCRRVCRHHRRRMQRGRAFVRRRSAATAVGIRNGGFTSVCDEMNRDGSDGNGGTGDGATGRSGRGRAGRTKEPGLR